MTCSRIWAKEVIRVGTRFVVLATWFWWLIRPRQRWWRKGGTRRLRTRWLRAPDSARRGSSYTITTWVTAHRLADGWEIGTVGWLEWNQKNSKLRVDGAAHTRIRPGTFDFCFHEMIYRKKIQGWQATTREKTNQGTSHEYWAGTCWAKLSSCRKIAKKGRQTGRRRIIYLKAGVSTLNLGIVNLVLGR